MRNILALILCLFSISSFAIDDAYDRQIKPGMVIKYSGSSCPSGYLAIDGTAVSRTTYAKLFSAIGTTYGVGNGSTTFNLPDPRQCRQFLSVQAQTGTGITSRPSTGDSYPWVTCSAATAPSVCTFVTNPVIFTQIPDCTLSNNQASNMYILTYSGTTTEISLQFNNTGQAPTQNIGILTCFKTGVDSFNAAKCDGNCIKY